MKKTLEDQHATSNKGEKRTKIIENRREFSYGSIVAINGRDMDEYNRKDRKEAPTFLGIVQNPEREAESIDRTCESYVTFVTFGHYEWLDTKMLNTLVFSMMRHLTSSRFHPHTTKKCGTTGQWTL